MKIRLTTVGAVLALTLSAVCATPTVSAGDAGRLNLGVYKSPQCDCCGGWVAHMQNAGFEIRTHDTLRLDQVKTAAGVAPRYRSCHTALWGQGEYVFEGHIPAPVIKRFLAHPPRGALGLAVPGMPMGSPGMEVDDRFQPYSVLQLNQDGTTTVYAEITERVQQYE